MSFWNILRVLTTNVCNYHCLYCHNEGQPQNDMPTFLDVHDFERVFAASEQTPIRQIRFSGGEPLLHPSLFSMIEMVYRRHIYEIGMATNGSLVTEDIAEKLAEYNVLVTLHFPGIDEESYAHITQNPFHNFIRCLESFEKYGVSYSFNFVLCDQTVSYFQRAISFAGQRNRRIKILPMLDFAYQDADIPHWMEVATHVLQQQGARRQYDAQTGISTLETPQHGIIKILPMSCARREISRCRSYGELRLLPNGTFKTCIQSAETVPVDFMTVEHTIRQMRSLWETFTHCPVPDGRS